MRRHVLHIVLCVMSMFPVVTFAHKTHSFIVQMSYDENEQNIQIVFHFFREHLQEIFDVNKDIKQYRSDITSYIQQHFILYMPQGDTLLLEYVKEYDVDINTSKVYMISSKVLENRIMIKNTLFHAIHDMVCYVDIIKTSERIVFTQNKNLQRITL